MYPVDYQPNTIEYRSGSASSDGTTSTTATMMMASSFASSMQESMETVSSSPAGYGNSNCNTSNMCTACGLKSVVCQTAFCSRRCSWSAEGKCPQCGRFRDIANAYCSNVCCQQALQANWCPCCGICQISSAGSCTNSMCAGATMVFCGDSRKQRQRMQHQLLPASDAARGGLHGPINQGFAAGFGRGIVNIIRINSSQASKKRYLSYRSNVESTLSRHSMSKYGHGGEGNEQRRFFPLSLCCGLGTIANGSSGSHIQCCGNMECGTCRVLTHGMRMGDTGEGSHYCTTSAPQSMCWSQPNASGCKALLVARCVIGNPELTVLDGETAAAPEIVIPENPEFVHCTILTNHDQSQDGTYLFRDDAIDPMFLVIFA